MNYSDHCCITSYARYFKSGNSAAMVSLQIDGMAMYSSTSPFAWAIEHLYLYTLSAMRFIILSSGLEISILSSEQLIYV